MATNIEASTLSLITVINDVYAYIMAFSIMYLMTPIIGTIKLHRKSETAVKVDHVLNLYYDPGHQVVSP